MSQRTKNDSGKNGTSLEIADSVSAKSTATLRYARHFFKFDGLQRGREVLDSVVCAFSLMRRNHRKSIIGGYQPPLRLADKSTSDTWRYARKCVAVPAHSSAIWMLLFGSMTCSRSALPEEKKLGRKKGAQWVN